MEGKNFFSLMARRVSTAVGIFVIIFASILTIVLVKITSRDLESLSSLSLAATASVPLSEAAANHMSAMALANLNKDFLNAFNLYQKAPNDERKKAELDKMLAIASNRSKKIIEAIENNPGLANAYALPTEIKNKMPEEVRLLVETKKTAKGQADVYISDNFEKEITSTDHYLIEEGTGKKTKLSLGKNNKNILTGDKIKVVGVEMGQVLAAESVEMLSTTVDSSITQEERRILVIISNFTDTSPLLSPATAVSRVFGDQNSVNTLYKETSFNQLGFNPDTDGNGSPDVVGPFTINAKSTDSCDYYSWAALAEEAARASGVNTGLYQHILHVIPSSNTCSWLGIANVGCRLQCRAWVAGADVDMIAHELGHNLSMRHSSTDTNNDGVMESEYGDYSDFMGMCGFGLRHNNGPHKYLKGWFGDVLGQVQTVTSSGVYKVGALALNPFSSSFPQVLKIDIPDSTNSYYLSFRGGVGYDSLFYSSTRLLPYSGGLAVHRASELLSPTYYIKTLKNGSVFSDTKTGLTVTQLDFRNDVPEPYVEIKVDLLPKPCTRSNPGIEISPTSIKTEPGQSLSVSATIKNNDSSGCPSSDLVLSANLPSDFVQIPASYVVTLPPGGTNVVPLTVVSTQIPGTYVLTERITNSSLTQYYNSVNFSVEVASSTVPVIVDDVPPIVKITKPKDGSAVPKKGDLTISTSASDQNGIASVTIKFDGVSIATCKKSICTGKVPVSTISVGTHNIAVTAVDNSEQSNEATKTITVRK
jgi:hypothetical protein